MRPAPSRPSPSRVARRHRVVRAAAVLVALAAPVVAGSPAQAMDMAAMSMDAPAAAVAPTTGAPAASVDPMIVVGTPERPLVTRGPQGPLWTLGIDAAMQGVVPDGSVSGPAERLTLSTAAATKKLSKRCQKLVKQSTKHLSKADKKKRAKCLDQRAKLIKDSKKTGSTSSPSKGSGTTTTTPGSTTSPGTTTTPGTTNPTPTSAPGEAVPTPTPKPGSTPVPTPVPTAVPTPTPAPAGCVAAGSSVTVTAVNAGEKLGVSRGCATGPTVTFTYDNTDPNTSHTLSLVTAESDGTTKDPAGTVYKIRSTTLAASTTAPPVSLDIPAGKYVLYCTIPGHTAMQIPFQVQ